jgi:hypothetical protein
LFGDQAAQIGRRNLNLIEDLLDCASRFVGALDEATLDDAGKSRLPHDKLLNVWFGDD